MNAFLTVLADNEATKPHHLPKCYFFPTHFYAKLLNSPEGFRYLNVRRWTKHADIFSMDLIFIPIHLHSSHWILVIINLLHTCFEYAQQYPTPVPSTSFTPIHPSRLP